ncbi:D-Ala-D-Ala carboxypeptidase family metallohydrolase, partial [Xanthomonadaceae bacterium JHOS43]|nr:D-Ala-D-Ala carboxypeptidase family metallohydrolase [Xanthomonadaceae bacterium JHOS43]
AIADGVATNKENRSLQYDARDRMTQATAPNQAGEEIYDYDVLDNVRRAAMTPDGLGGYVQDYRYLYDANHRLYRIDNAAGTQQWGFAHNTFGETLTRAGSGKNWSYQWNAAGRMTQGQQVYAGTTWETYAYDAHGRRTLSTRNTGTTRHQVYNRAGQLLYVEDTRDNQRIDYIHLGGKLVAQRSRPIATSTATVTYHHTDHISSANVETNTAGTQTHRTVRMPYGSPYNGIYREGPGFAGHVTDTQTNLTYMQQRYYDPVALRFLSPDPVHVSATDGSNFNRYWYANNNPYRYKDPDGRQSQPVREYEVLIRTPNADGGVAVERKMVADYGIAVGGEASGAGSVTLLPQQSAQGAPAVVGREIMNRLMNFSEKEGKTVEVTSGERAPEQNAAVGGAPASQHLSDNAADIRIQGNTTTQTADAAHKSGEFNRVNEYSNGRGVHVDLRSDGKQGRFDNWRHRDE